MTRIGRLPPRFLFQKTNLRNQWNATLKNGLVPSPYTMDHPNLRLTNLGAGGFTLAFAGIATWILMARPEYADVAYALYLGSVAGLALIAWETYQIRHSSTFSIPAFTSKLLTLVGATQLVLAALLEFLGSDGKYLLLMGVSALIGAVYWKRSQRA